MSTSNKLLKMKRERGNSKTEKTSKKSQNKKLKSKSKKILNISNIEQKERESIKSIDIDIDEDNLEETKENSLGQLTRNFLQYIKQKGRINININDLVKDLSVKKRRLYDITNVLQGIGYIEKKGKNEISWTTNYKNQNLTNSDINNNSLEENIKANYSKLKDEYDDLKKEDEKIEEELNKYNKEFELLPKKHDFPRYGYVTFKDISNLSKNEKLDFVVIKAQKGTVINVIDDDESKKAFDKIKKQMECGKILQNEKLLSTLENKHHIFFTNKDEKLKLYRVHNGDISEIAKNYQNCAENNDNKNNSFSFNNSLISNNNESNIKNNIIFKDKEYIPTNIKENTNKQNIFEQSINLNNNQTECPQSDQTTKEIKKSDNINNIYNSENNNNNNNSHHIFTFDNKPQNSNNNYNSFNFNNKNINNDDINKK